MPHASLECILPSFNLLLVCSFWLSFLSKSSPAVIDEGWIRTGLCPCRRMIFGAKLEKQSRQAILGLYLLAVVGHAESFSCRFKFSCRPVGSTGDFWPLCAQAVPVNFSARSPQWGLKNALGKPWCRFLREAREGGVQEFEFRADIWMQT